MCEVKSSERLDPGLARRLHGALTAGPEELFQLVQDPSPEVLRALLKNPRLGEDHLQALLKRRDLSEDLLKAVFRLDKVEAGHRLKVALVYNPGTPGAVVQTLLPQLYLFELANLCHLPGVTPDQKVAAERVIIQRLPTTPLGNKLTLARRGTGAVVAELFKEGDARLIEACLLNSRLKEAAILQFLGSSRATAETISAVARHPRWKSRPNIRLAILKNPHTPAVWFTLFLPALRIPELNNLLTSRRLTPRQKMLVEEELGKRSGTGD
jgi:hypothetical protein